MEKILLGEILGALGVLAVNAGLPFHREDAKDAKKSPSVIHTPPFLVSSLSADPEHQVTASDAGGKPGAVAVNQAASSSEPEASPSRTERGLAAHTKEAASAAYRSASDTFRQSGKRSAGYFSKLAASVRKVY